MILFLVFLGTAAVVGIVGTAVAMRRDGYRRVPARPEAVWGPAGVPARAAVAASVPVAASVADAAPASAAARASAGVPQRLPQVTSGCSDAISSLPAGVSS